MTINIKIISMKKRIELVLFGLLSVWLGATAGTDMRADATGTDGDVKEIHELTLTGLTKPVIGELPNNDVSIDDTVVIDFMCWSVYSEDEDCFYSLWEGKYEIPFEEGKKYIFMLHVLPKDGYKFADDLKFLYNSTEIPDYEEGVSSYTFKGMGPDGLMIVCIGQEDMMAGLEDVKFAESENDFPADVFNMQGILVKRNASKADLHSLPSGIYIVHGKKVIVK